MKKKLLIDEILEHNNDIIEDNLVFGYKSGTPKEEIDKYYADAKRKQKELREHLNTGGEVDYDRTTEMYIKKTINQ